MSSGQPFFAVKLTNALRARTARRWRPLRFGVHQGAEYALAAGLVDLSLHTRHPYLLYAAAATMAAESLATRGPLCLATFLPRRIHAAADTVLPFCFAIGPLVPSLRPDLVGMLSLELGMLAWLRISTLTRYSEPATSTMAVAPAARSGASSGTSASGTADAENGSTSSRRDPGTPAHGSSPPGAQSPISCKPSFSRLLGRAAGSGTARAAVGSERLLLRGARLAGRMAGTARQRRETRQDRDSMDP